MDPSSDRRGAVSRAQLGMLATALVIAVCDQAVKRVVVSVMEIGRSIDVLGSFARLTRTSNTGAAFGLFRGRGPVFIVISLIAAIAITAFSRQIARARRIERVAFGLILGGAVGNLIDRIRLGAVVDFIDIGVGAVRWPTFNIADSAITIGVTLLAVSVLFLGRQAAEGNGAELRGEAR
jgi:signal peptidase II